MRDVIVASLYRKLLLIFVLFWLRNGQSGVVYICGAIIEGGVNIAYSFSTVDSYIVVGNFEEDSLRRDRDWRMLAFIPPVVHHVAKGIRIARVAQLIQLIILGDNLSCGRGNSNGPCPEMSV